MINTITITGRVTAKPEVKLVKGRKENTAVTKFNIAVNKNESTTFFFPVVAWGALAEALENYVNKGDKITISGYLAYEEWENDDGEKRSRIYIVSQSVEFMTKSKSGKAKNKPAKRTKSNIDVDDEEFYYDP